MGGERKGFHAVALRDGAYLAQVSSPDPVAVAAWCHEIGARAVGVDAPCRWSSTGRARPAERALMKQGVWCFSTPSRDAAAAHPNRQFEWMLNGESLFHELEKTHRLFDGALSPDAELVCFETFPQAIACALAGTIVSAKRKATLRRALLEQAGVASAGLRNIDWLDAALCSVAASALLANKFSAYGEVATGLIVLPKFG